MHRLPPLPAVLAAAIALAGPVRAADPGPDSGILEQAAAKYESLDRFLFEGLIQVDVRAARGPQSQRMPFRIARDGQGRVRDEISSGPAAGMIVSDGREVITYNAMLAQYTRRPGNVDSALAGGWAGGVGAALLSRLSAAGRGVREIRRLPDETLPFGAVKRPCVVLDVAYGTEEYGAGVTEDPRRYWIDRETHVVLRVRTLLRADAPQYGGKIEQEETISFSRAVLDGPLPDSLWAFHPPEGVREVQQFSRSNEDLASVFTGKPAIDFTLKDLEGRSHSLKNLRGKTVLLDFWATWCGPCRITMPQVAKIHAEYGGRGVEVMSINVGESAAKAGAYMKRYGYEFISLLDPDREVSFQYRVNGIPTLVVIDAKGTVTDYLVGARDDAALRAALKKAGVK